MEEVVISPLVLDKLESLVELLFEKEYFSYWENADAYVDDLIDFIGSHLFSIMSDDNDDYKGNIKDLTADCDAPSERNLAVKCQIIIQYKPMGETGITFFVGLDKNKQPDRILNNRVQIDRGD